MYKQKAVKYIIETKDTSNFEIFHFSHKKVPFCPVLFQRWLEYFR